MNIDYQAAQFWVQFMFIFVNIGLWLFVWNSNKSKVTNAQLDEHAVTLAAFEERLKNALGHPDLEPLHKRMNNMDKQLGEIKGKMHTLDLIHELLLKRGE